MSKLKNANLVIELGNTIIILPTLFMMRKGENGGVIKLAGDGGGRLGPMGLG